MNAPSIDVKTILVAETSLGLTYATNLFVGKELATPANSVTIFDGVSSPPMLTFAKGENYYYDAVQIRIRNTAYDTGYALAKDIMDTLHGIGQETVNGTLYTVISCTNGPAMLGWDDNGRVIFVMNFELQRR